MPGYVSIPRKAPPVVPAEPEPEPAYTDSARKADLIAAAEARGLDTDGTKADLLDRLRDKA